MFASIVQRLQSSRDQLTAGLARLIGSTTGRTVDLKALEVLLLEADLGVGVVDPLMARLRAAMAAPEWRQQSREGGVALQRGVRMFLNAALLEWLQPCEAPLKSAVGGGGVQPFVIMVLGVNGSGKTTTAAKLAGRAHRAGRRVILGAADTFRAAAINQLQRWGARLGVEVIAQPPGADPAAVAFDAVQAGLSRRADLVCIDTAGRLHTKSNLIEELKKIVRVMGKALAGAPHERLLVIDATVGQNGLAQARQFHEAVGVTGLAVTKLDGTAKGGIVVAIAQTLKLPIRYVGVGEAADDLLDFDAAQFVEALLGKEGG